MQGICEDAMLHELTVYEKLARNHVPTDRPYAEVCFKCPIMLSGEFSGGSSLCMLCLLAQMARRERIIKERLFSNKTQERQ